jgi:hypothetical protein
MLLKFVLKNLILVAVIAFVINWFITTNIHFFSRSVVSHGSQLEELTQEELLQESQILKDRT